MECLTATPTPIRASKAQQDWISGTVHCRIYVALDHGGAIWRLDYPAYTGSLLQVKDA